jgi:hypothetical protein
MIPKITPLKLCFKGERNYLQGGDLCNAVMEAVGGSSVGEAVRFQLAFHRFIAKQPDMVWLEGDKPSSRPENVAAEFSVSGSLGKASGWLIETDREVDCRIPFDEERIARHCSFGGESVSILADSGYLPIEVVVSMTKLLHNRLLPASSARWIFTKLDLSRCLVAGDASALTITLKQNLHGRLTKSEVNVHGRSLGFIYFSLVRR